MNGIFLPTAPVALTLACGCSVLLFAGCQRSPVTAPDKPAREVETQGTLAASETTKRPHADTPAAAPADAILSPETNADLQAADLEETVEAEEAAEPADLDDTVEQEVSSQPAAHHRLWLPTTAGPLLVDLDIWIGDRPLTAAFAARLQQISEEAGAEAGSVGWETLLTHVAAHPERYGASLTQMTNMQRQVIRRYDVNGNRLAEADELAPFLFQQSSSTSPFRLQGTDFYRKVNRAGSPFWKTIDADGDRVLSADELDRASERCILAFDRNADDRIDWDEVLSDTQAEEQAWSSRRISRRGDMAMDLDGPLDWTSISYALRGQRPQRLWDVERSFLDELDQDGDERLSEDESEQLRHIPADLSLTLRFAAAGSSPPTIEATCQPCSVEASATMRTTPRMIRITLPSFQFVAEAVDRPSNGNRFPAEAFAMLDANDDNELDETEIPAGLQATFSFAERDRNDDGVLTIDEFTAVEQSTVPLWSVQVRGRGSEVPDGVFAWLDRDSNRFLSSREIQGIPERLREIADDDGTVQPQDVPDTFLLQLVRGDPQRDEQSFRISPLPSPTDPPHPYWATQMDANRDGDVSQQEFPGRAETFQAIDRDDDHYLDADETQQATSNADVQSRVPGQPL